METVLPPKYYHDNFEYVLAFVKEKYKSLLIESEWHFLRKYYSLPHDAQCLFVRFTNRKGLFFKTENLKYEEIDYLENQILILKERDFISEISDSIHLSFIIEILTLFNKPDLLKIFPDKSYKSLKKDEIVAAILEKIDPKEVFEIIKPFSKNIIKLNFEKEVSFLRFLFFGNKYMDMTEFVLRDLGLIQYYQHNEDDLIARFETRKDAEDKWMISDQFLIFENLKAVSSSKEILDWFLVLRQNLLDLSPVANPSWERLQLRVGKYLEQLKDYESSLEIYKPLNVHPARERSVRCMAKLGFIEESRAQCLEILKSPLNADEQYFAEFFIKNLEGKKNKKQTTEWLKNASQIMVPSEYKYQVELGAISHFHSIGFEAAFSENHVWRALFGLVFWDIVFDPALVAFHHPFQRRPSDLYLPDFYQKRKDLIEAFLYNIEDKDSLFDLMWKNWNNNNLIANPFVVWLPEIWDLVRVLVSNIEIYNIKSILLKIAENLVENSRGLPDLMIWNNYGHLEFIEIKSPNDSLSNQQLFWLRFLNENGVNARVLRVGFDLTPQGD